MGVAPDEVLGRILAQATGIAAGFAPARWLRDDRLVKRAHLDVALEREEPVAQHGFGRYALAVGKPGMVRGDVRHARQASQSRVVVRPLIPRRRSLRCGSPW